MCFEQQTFKARWNVKCDNWSLLHDLYCFCLRVVPLSICHGKDHSILKTTGQNNMQCVSVLIIPYLFITNTILMSDSSDLLWMHSVMCWYWLPFIQKPEISTFSDLYFSHIRAIYTVIMRIYFSYIQCKAFLLFFCIFVFLPLLREHMEELASDFTCRCALTNFMIYPMLAMFILSLIFTKCNNDLWTFPGKVVAIPGVVFTTYCTYC